MGNFQIPIVKIPRKSPRVIDEVLEADEIQNADGASTTLHQVRVKGSLVAVHRDILFQGTITGSFVGPCDRCIEPAQAQETINVSWLFEPGVAVDPLKAFADSEDSEEDEEFDDEDQDDEVKHYEGDTLDLTPHVMEELTLATPSKMYCTDDCKGLCPHCGVNANLTTCDCKEETEHNNSGLKALKDLYPDLPSNPSEE